MGRLRDLRARFINGIGAVKRSVLRRQSQTSTASNSTTLTRLVSVDSAVATADGPRSRDRGALKRKLQAQEPETQQLQLHWNEARRIYSEPVQAIDGLCKVEESINRSSTDTTVTECRSLSCGAIPERYAKKSPSRRGSLSDSVQVLVTEGCAQLSDEEEYDDVFLQSWEEQSGYGYTEDDFLLGGVEKSNSSEISSGYSTISNDNLPSPALYLPPPAGDGGYAELEQREGGVSGWDNWRIAENEVTLGNIVSSTELETIYSGYWHGNICVRSRRIREVEDLTCFLDEVTTLSCIRHENIQLFMGACLNMQEGTLAIIMSEIKGESLHTRLHSYGHAFTNPSKIKILRQIAEGMEYLHSRGIPHGLLSSQSISLHYRVCISLAPQYSRSNARQLDPCNIPYLPPETVRELCPSRRRSRGAASCQHEGDHSSRRRVHSCGDKVGSCVLWASSEKRACMIQLKGRPTLPADVFAFGTIVYELVMLEYPYKSLPLESKIWRIGKGDLQALTLIPKGRLRGIIGQCWKESPQQRPTFKDLLASIEQDVVMPCAKMMSSLQPSHSLPCITSLFSPSSST